MVCSRYFDIIKYGAVYNGNAFLKLTVFPMPRKKKLSNTSPVQEPPILLPPPPPTEEQAVHQHVGHLTGIYTFGMLFIFTALLTLSQAMHAQEFRAQVSARVVQTDYVPPETIPFQRWWNSLDTYNKLMVGGSSVLVVSVVPLGLLVWKTRKRTHHQPA